VEVCAKFGGDWSGGLRMKEGHRYIGTVSFIDIDCQITKPNFVIFFLKKHAFFIEMFQ